MEKRGDGNTCDYNFLDRATNEGIYGRKRKEKYNTSHGLRITKVYERWDIKGMEKITQEGSCEQGSTHK